MLKYSCLKNLAAISLKKDLLDKALDYYYQALKIEGTDVSLWYQAGCTAIKLGHMTVACHSFLEVWLFYIRLIIFLVIILPCIFFRV